MPTGCEHFTAAQRCRRRHTVGQTGANRQCHLRQVRQCCWGFPACDRDQLSVIAIIIVVTKQVMTWALRIAPVFTPPIWPSPCNAEAISRRFLSVSGLQETTWAIGPAAVVPCFADRVGLLFVQGWLARPGRRERTYCQARGSGKREQRNMLGERAREWSRGGVHRAHLSAGGERGRIHRVQAVQVPSQPVSGDRLRQAAGSAMPPNYSMRRRMCWAGQTEAKRACVHSSVRERTPGRLAAGGRLHGRRRVAPVGDSPCAPCVLGAFVRWRDDGKEERAIVTLQKLPQAHRRGPVATDVFLSVCSPRPSVLLIDLQDQQSRDRVAVAYERSATATLFTNEVIWSAGLAGSCIVFLPLR